MRQWMLALKLHVFGIRRPITRDMRDMRDDIEVGYAVTVHKARGSQGSQWSRVIIRVSTSRLLGRTLPYTAVTRA